MSRKTIELVEEILTLAKNDDTGVTDDLIDLAYQAGEEAGMTKDYMDRIWNEA